MFNAKIYDSTQTEKVNKCNIALWNYVKKKK